MIRLMLPVVGALAIWSNVSIAAESAASYRLNPADVVKVFVWGEDKLSQEVTVLPDGSITLPLAGKVEAAGLDATTVAAKIANQLEKFIPDPQVSVSVTSTAGNRIFVQGKVLKPGEVHLTGQTTVLQALSMAGGFEKFADKDDIKVVRLNGTKEEVLKVNYDDLVSGHSMATNHLLRAGDTLVVP